MPTPSMTPTDESLPSVNGIGWNSYRTAPDRVVAFNSLGFSILPLWLKAPRGEVPFRLECKFPPCWDELCGIRFSWYSGQNHGAFVWNKDHPLVKASSQNSWISSRKLLRRSEDPVIHRDKLLSDANLAASWLLQCISSSEKEIWEGIAERDPELITTLFNQVASHKALRKRRILFWTEDPSVDSHLTVLDKASWTKIFARGNFEEFLPKPPEDWQITRAPKGQR